MFVNQKGNFTTTLGVIIVLVIISSSAYYLVANYIKSEYQTQTSNPPSLQKTNSLQAQNPATLPNISNWKTYTSNEFGFSIQYPEELYTVNNEKILVSLIPREEFNNKKPQAATYAISIASTPNSNDFSLSTPSALFGNGPILSYSPESQDTYPILETTLGGLKAFRSNGCTCDGEVGIAAEILTIKEAKVYQIVIKSYQMTGDPNTNREIYEKILSTFRFTD